MKNSPILILFTCLFSSHQTYAAEIISLGDLPGDIVFSYGHGISDDGSTVVGSSISSIGIEAFVYQNGQMIGLGDLPGGEFGSEANGVSADGTTIVGESYSSSGIEAFVYQNGQMIGLGDLPGGEFLSQAKAISDDGNTVVGRSQSINGEEAFIYNNGQLTGLGDLLGGGFGSFATNTSPDGSIVVGGSLSIFGVEAFIYQNNKMIGLGNLDGISQDYSEGYANDLSSDGSKIVGYSENYAAIWLKTNNESYAVKRLQDYLLEYGVDITLSNWSSLYEAKAISNDGNYITGWGYRNGNKEAFLLDLSPEANSIPIPTIFLIIGGILISLLASKKTVFMKFLS